LAFSSLTQRVNKPRNKIIFFSSGVIQFVCFCYYYCYYCSHYCSRDSVFYIGTKLWAGSVMSSITNGNKVYFFLRNVKNCFTAHPVSYVMFALGSFPRIKRQKRET